MHRVTYSKEGLIKFISHLDLVRMWQRAFRRAGLRVKMSHGFSPHPIISFGPPLPLGISSRCELLDVAFVPGQDLTSAMDRLNRALPGGIRIHELRPVPDSGGSLCAEINRASYKAVIDPGSRQEAAEKIEAARRAPELVARSRRDNRERCRNIRPMVEEIELVEGSAGEALVRFTVCIGDEGNLNPRELLGAVLGWPESRIQALPMTRTALFTSAGRAKRRNQGPGRR